ncbi:MAG: hypothetical protein IKG18_10515 [Atopobiaceae bacterium]|nr:hypothetical protein [Atopobiaceae bacterium]
MTSDTPVLAVYDFRSKQAFIYRTNRMKEITGASELIAGMYGQVLDALDNAESGLRIRHDWNDENPRPLFDANGAPTLADDEAGAVVYEGGGNLLVLYRNREAYIAANKVFSRVVADEAYSLSMIAGCAEWEASKERALSDFEWNRRRAYAALDRYKRIGNTATPCNVLPYTMVSRATYQPIVGVRPVEDELIEVTQEAQEKLDAFEAKARVDREWAQEGKFVDRLGTKKGVDSLIAVLYFDGNSIGERVKRAVSEGASQHKRDEQVMREFSKGLHKALVTETEEAMKQAIDAVYDVNQRGYRIIIDHGDEITLICNAHTAPLAMNAYFEAIADSGYHACGGMAICHPHDPFAEVYRIAEECCESGKSRNRKAQLEGQPDASYVDFHFCRSGITGTLESIRDKQEKHLTARPYVVGGSYEAFLGAGRALRQAQDEGKLTRTDLKELNRAILRGKSWYLMELERLKSKSGDALRTVSDIAVKHSIDLRPLLFDVTSFWDVFDLCFSAKSATNSEGGM